MSQVSVFCKDVDAGREGSARRLVLCCVAIIGLLLFSSQSLAHPMAPSLLSLKSGDVGHYTVTWKTPLQGPGGAELRPLLPESCREISERQLVREGTGLVATWQVDCGGALTGKTVAVDGIESNRAGVLLRVEQAGVSLQRLLTVSEPDFIVPEDPSRAGLALQYLSLGIEHLLIGLDHVLFVVALFLLVRGTRALVITITAFTIGHSVTLSAAVLGFVSFSQDIAEVIIAFSVIVAFAEVLRNDPNSLIRRKPWIIAFGFGLLHGLGFAGALSEAGLPPNDIPLALVSFNVGIEVGQLILVALLLAITLAWRRGLVKRLWPVTAQGPAATASLLSSRMLLVYAVGTLAGFWFWQRIAMLMA